MIKKTIVLLSCLGILFIISGTLFAISYYSACASSDTESKENVGESESQTIGLDAFKKKGYGLWMERIAYHKNRQKTPYEIFDSIGDECRHFLKDFCV